MHSDGAAIFGTARREGMAKKVHVSSLICSKHFKHLRVELPCASEQSALPPGRPARAGRLQVR